MMVLVIKTTFTELTYILFLKMSKEQGQEDDIPEKYRWDSLFLKKDLN
jgi:type I restriction enzyme M protein